jgi:hypothetical protein
MDGERQPSDQRRGGLSFLRGIATVNDDVACRHISRARRGMASRPERRSHSRPGDDRLESFRVVEMPARRGARMEVSRAGAHPGRRLSLLREHSGVGHELPDHPSASDRISVAPDTERHKDTGSIRLEERPHRLVEMCEKPGPRVAHSHQQPYARGDRLSVLRWPPSFGDEFACCPFSRGRQGVGPVVESSIDATQSDRRLQTPLLVALPPSVPTPMADVCAETSSRHWLSVMWPRSKVVVLRRPSGRATHRLVVALHIRVLRVQARRPCGNGIRRRDRVGVAFIPAGMN